METGNKNTLANTISHFENIVAQLKKIEALEALVADMTKGTKTLKEALIDANKSRDYYQHLFSKALDEKREDLIEASRKEAISRNELNLMKEERDSLLKEATDAYKERDANQKIIDKQQTNIRILQWDADARDERLKEFCCEVCGKCWEDCGCLCDCGRDYKDCKLECEDDEESEFSYSEGDSESECEHEEEGDDRVKRVIGKCLIEKIKEDPVFLDLVKGGDVFDANQFTDDEN